MMEEALIMCYIRETVLPQSSINFDMISASVSLHIAVFEFLVMLVLYLILYNNLNLQTL